MDGRQFDALAERMATGRSRRRKLASFGGALTGLASVALSGDVAGAKRGSSCPAGQVCCPSTSSINRAASASAC